MVAASDPPDKPPRRNLSKRLRYEVLRRDNHACRYCGATAPGVKLTVDHVVPVTLGGSDEPGNLVTACVDCNAGKSATPPGAPLVADVAQDAVRWAQAMAAATAVRVAEQEEIERHVEYVDDVWREHLDPEERPTDWGHTVALLLRSGLVYVDFEDGVAATVRAHPRDSWRYFCGVAWNTLRVRQDEARKLLDAGF